MLEGSRASQISQDVIGQICEKTKKSKFFFLSTSNSAENSSSSEAEARTKHRQNKNRNIFFVNEETSTDYDKCDVRKDATFYQLVEI